MNFEISKVSRIIEIGEGSRVALDFIDILGEQEGVLVGDSAKGYVCVLAENRKTETYPPRPFRVNAGAIHQYIQMGNDTTKYLSEIEPGDKVLVTDGKSERFVAVGRVKIEKREFIKIFLESGISATLQCADSIFIGGNKEVLHLVDLKENDEVGFISESNCARHKGRAVDEYIEEK